MQGVKREQTTQNDRGGVTFGDVLSAGVKADLEKLHGRLEQPARENAKAQLGRPTLQSNLQQQNQCAASAGENGKARAGASFRFWDFPSGMQVRGNAPTYTSRESRMTFDRTVAAGASTSGSTEDSVVFILIGLDFGTSSTKIIARLPFEAGEPTVAIPAPEHCRSENHLYLWQTILWLHGNGEFLAYPEHGVTLFRDLKQGVMASEPDAAIIPEAIETNGVTRVEAAVAYLAYAIRYVRGWLKCNRPALFRGRETRWFVNLGLPAADYDNGTLVRAYRKTAAAALMLADSGEAVCVKATRKFLRHQRVENSARLPKEAEKLGIAVVPEVAAAATPFAKSTNSVRGPYLLVDVGAATLDACTFRLVQQQGGENKYPLLSATVRPLGVEAFHWFRAQGRTEVEFREQCNRCLYQVIWDTKRVRDPHADCWKSGNVLPVFLTGGGSRNALHRCIIKALGPWLSRHTTNEGIRLIDISPPDSMELPEPLADLSRLVVAWGLSYPREEIGEIKSMSNIGDININLPRRPNLADHYG